MNVLVVVVVVAAIGLLFVVLYNGLAQLRVRADSAWSDIDIQLKRRHDLVPNLVETVKGYAAHEKGTFENVAKFRSAAMSAASPDERAQAEGGLTMALRGLLAVATLHSAGQMQFQATPSKGAEPERLNHADCLDATPGHRFSCPR